MFAGVDTGSRLYNTPKNTFLPRVGFAYQLNPKTVIRGGVGLFAGFLGERRGDVIQTGYSQTTTVGTDDQRQRRADPAVAGTTRSSPRRSSSRSATPTAGRRASGSAITFFNQDPKVSKQLRWQIGFQRELPGGLVVEAAYVGNYGYNIEIVRNINALPNQYLNTDNSRTAAMNANNTFLTGVGREPVRRAAAGHQLQQRDDRPLAAAAPVPRVRGHHHDEQRRQVAGTTPASSACRSGSRKGYTLGVSYTLLALDAGDRVPERRRPEADQDDLGPGRAAPAVDQRHLRAARSARGSRFLSDASGFVERRSSAAGRSRASTPTRRGFPVAFGSFNATPHTRRPLLQRRRRSRSATRPPQQWFNTDAFTSILTDTSTQRDAGQPPADDSRTGSTTSAGIPSTTSTSSLLKNVRLQRRHAAAAAGSSSSTRSTSRTSRPRSWARRRRPSGRSRRRTRPTTPGARRSASSSCSSRDAVRLEPRRRRAGLVPRGRVRRVLSRVTGRRAFDGRNDPCD